jgi:hypothetical protein
MEKEKAIKLINATNKINTANAMFRNWLQMEIENLFDEIGDVCWTKAIRLTDEEDNLMSVFGIMKDDDGELSIYFCYGVALTINDVELADVESRHIFEFGNDFLMCLINEVNGVVIKSMKED